MSNQKQQDRSDPQLRHHGRLLTVADEWAQRATRNAANWRKWAKQKMSKRRRRHDKQIAKGE